MSTGVTPSIARHPVAGDSSSEARNRTVKVRILGKDMQIGCAAEDEENLQKAAQYVNSSMSHSRDRNKTLSLEKLAIVSAINIANDLLRQESTVQDDSALSAQLQNLSAKIDEAISS